MTITPRRPMAFGYARVSDDKQIKQDDSIPFQMKSITGYYQLKLGDLGVDWGGIEADPKAVSATRTPFHLRKAGAKLMEHLQPGDHIIIDKIDRLARQSKDLHDMLDWFKKNKIRLHIVNLLGMSLDLDSPIGEFMVGMFGLLARWEAAVISDRTRCHNEFARREGRAITGTPLSGTRHVTRTVKGKSRIYVEWDPDQRALMKEVVRLHDEEGLNCHQIADRFEHDHCARNGQVFRKSAFVKRKWGKNQVSLLYAIERFITDHKIMDVCDLPRDAQVQALKHIRETKALRLTAEQHKRRVRNSNRTLRGWG